MFLNGSGGSTPPPGTTPPQEAEQPARRGAGQPRPASFLTNVFWSFAMVVCAVGVAALAIPLLRWLGFMD